MDTDAEMRGTGTQTNGDKDTIKREQRHKRTGAGTKTPGKQTDRERDTEGERYRQPWTGTQTDRESDTY
jgi:hypothetical protein